MVVQRRVRFGQVQFIEIPNGGYLLGKNIDLNLVYCDIFIHRFNVIVLLGFNTKYNMY